MRQFSSAQVSVLDAISPNDAMYTGDSGHYFSVSESALACIELALRAAGRERKSINSILDLPCGHGRVLRAIRAAFPQAALTACDLDRDAVDFCAATFAANPVYSDLDLSCADLPGNFDLIWCGSLITHFDEARAQGALDFFLGQLAMGGILVISSHGRVAIDVQFLAEEYDPQFRGHKYMEDKRFSKVLKGYYEKGFGYADYYGHQNYGISMQKLSWTARFVEERPDCQLLLLSERLWSNHHDILALRKVSE